MKTRTGADAAATVDAETLQHFAELRELALNASREELRAKGIGLRTSVLLIRARATRAELANLEGSGYFAFAVDKGWHAQDSSTELDLTEPEITGDAAEAKAILRGVQTQIPLRFVAENGDWRFKYVDLVKRADAGDRQIQQRSGVEEDELIVRSLERALGKTLPESIWEPMK